MVTIKMMDGFLVAVREIDFRLKNNEIKIYF